MPFCVSTQLFTVQWEVQGVYESAPVQRQHSPKRHCPRCRAVLSQSYPEVRQLGQSAPSGK